MRGFFLTLLIVATGCVPQAAHGLQLPANYPEAYVQYATVDRVDGISRDLYINTEAADALRRGNPLPEGTTIILEAFQAQHDSEDTYLMTGDGHFQRAHPLEMLHVMQLRRDWQAEDFPTENRTGPWNFGSFDRETREPFAEDLGACFNCHNGTPETDFVYTLRELTRYTRTGETQYYYCNRTGRITCIPR